jgi:hypothetical protein
MRRTKKMCTNYVLWPARGNRKLIDIKGRGVARDNRAAFANFA